MTKNELCERMCPDCLYIDIDPGDYYEPPSWDCPGGGDPEDLGCPRRAEAAELRAEEDMEIEIEIDLEVTTV